MSISPLDIDLIRKKCHYLNPSYLRTVMQILHRLWTIFDYQNVSQSGSKSVHSVSYSVSSSVWPCNSSGDQPLLSHPWHRESIPRDFRRVSWRMQWHCVKFFSKFFGFPVIILAVSTLICDRPTMCATPLTKRHMMMSSVINLELHLWPSLGLSRSKDSFRKLIRWLWFCFKSTDH
jgi:hypothetical protein